MQTIFSGCTGITCPTNSVTVSTTTNQITTSPETYDLSGNMTNDGLNTMTYDGEGRAVTAGGGLGSGTYTYDGNGLRVEKVAGGTTTVYIFSGSKVIAEYANGAAPSSPTREYIYAGGALLARIDSSGTNYYHQDHLSNRMVTNSSGGVVAEMGHFPFGESWYNATNDKLYFTTYEYDSESGNHYAMARYHVSRLGRLSSPDPIAGSTGNPQSLNRYSYSINDPANVTDPSGADPVSSCTTVQAKPKDQSQQASGGGHSDAGNSDADTAGDAGNADSPQQSGCVSHVNPFGSGSDGVGLDGSDITDLSGDLSGLLGSSAWVGKVDTTGVNTGSGLVPQVVEYNLRWSTWTNGPLGPSTTSGTDVQWAVLWLPAPGGLLTPPDSGLGGNGPGNSNQSKADIARCAADFSSKYSLAAGFQALTGVNQNNKAVNAFLGSDTATLSNLITGPSRLDALVSRGIYQGTVGTGKIVGNLPDPTATGLKSVGKATVRETAAGGAEVTSWTDATIATSLFGRAVGKAFAVFSIGKLAWDVSTYAVGALKCR